MKTHGGNDESGGGWVITKLISPPPRSCLAVPNPTLLCVYDEK